MGHASSPMSRHGKIAEDKTHILFIAPKVLKEELRELAAEERRTLSAFIVVHLEALVARRKAEKQRLAKTLADTPPASPELLAELSRILGAAAKGEVPAPPAPIKPPKKPAKK